jgi:hypothetical protein
LIKSRRSRIADLTQKRAAPSVLPPGFTGNTIGPMSILFPTDTFHRTGADGLFDAVFRTALRQNDLGFLFIFVERKHITAQLDASLAAHTFIRINHNSFSHDTTSTFAFLLMIENNYQIFKSDPEKRQVQKCWMAVIRAGLWAANRRNFRFYFPA